MMLSEIKGKVNIIWERNKKDIVTAAAVFLIGMIGFGLGRLSAIIPEKKPLRIVPRQEAKQQAAIAKTISGIVASKNGSVYYFPWCSNTIKEENKLYFEGEEDAQKQGLRLAKNCEP